MTSPGSPLKQKDIEADTPEEINVKSVGVSSVNKSFNERATIKIQIEKFFCYKFVNVSTVHNTHLYYE